MYARRSVVDKFAVFSYIPTMKRRSAITHIAAGVAGISLLPGCLPEQLPVLKHFVIERKDYKFLQQFSQLLLPVPEDYPLPESQENFVLGMVDTCFDAKDISKFHNGLLGLSEYFKTNHNKPIKRFAEEERQEVLTTLASSELDKPLSDTVAQIRSLLIRQFQTSQRYQLDHLEFEFAPGYYETCADVS